MVLSTVAVKQFERPGRCELAGGIVGALNDKFLFTLSLTGLISNGGYQS